jgi:hypothetical protein
MRHWKRAAPFRESSGGPGPKESSSASGPLARSSVLWLAPVPARLKEWAYAGFAITLGSALIAHFAVGDGPEAWGFAAGTSVLWGLSYFFWRRLEAMPGIA